jgi:hypothetical protein
MRENEEGVENKCTPVQVRFKLITMKDVKHVARRYLFTGGLFHRSFEISVSWIVSGSSLT